MNDHALLGDLPEALASALRGRGFESLTPIQQKVLEADHKGRDLRITSQTGSGKTVALGFALADELKTLNKPARVASPKALIVAPTRELATQVGRELAWLFEGLRAKVVTLTGGTSVGLDRRALSSNPEIIVGTPGRIGDHLRSGTLELGSLGALALDEADEMLDMGFREELDAIVAAANTDRRTHLVSATFAGEVLRLANKFQRDPIHLEGTRLGAANEDIEHRAVVIRASDKADALINILLMDPRERTLIFTRTRAGASSVASGLAELGFQTRALHGEMTQRERNETLDAFRKGYISILVATDVAARGLDIEAITRVVQFDLPENAETFTHRSGRTGRAGRQGVNYVFVPVSMQRKADFIFRDARVRAEITAPPTPDEIRVHASERFIEGLELGIEEGVDEEIDALAEELLERFDAGALVRELLRRSPARLPAEPRMIAPASAKRQRRMDDDHQRGPRGRDQREARTNERFTPFQMSWGSSHGAEIKRVLALVCRRGQISGGDVGKIVIGPHSTRVEIVDEKAQAFEHAVSRPDPRDPHIRFRRWSEEPPQRRESPKKAGGPRSSVGRAAGKMTPRSARRARVSA